MRKYLLILVLSFFLLSPVLVLGQDEKTDSDPIPCNAGEACINNPITPNSPQALIGQIINVVLGIVGSLALIMFVFGGITWMTSSGSPEKVKRGRDILIWAAIGLVIIFSSYALTNFVIKGIAQ